MTTEDSTNRGKFCWVTSSENSQRKSWMARQLIDLLHTHPQPPRTTTYQHLQHSQMSLTGSNHEWCPSVFVSLFNVRTSQQQGVSNLPLARLYCAQQGRECLAVGSPNVCSFLKHVLDNLLTAMEACCRHSWVKEESRDMSLGNAEGWVCNVWLLRNMLDSSSFQTEQWRQAAIIAERRENHNRHDLRNAWEVIFSFEQLCQFFFILDNSHCQDMGKMNCYFIICETNLQYFSTKYVKI